MVNFTSSKILIISSLLFLGACTAGVTPVGQKLNSVGELVRQLANKEIDAIAEASWEIICNDLTWRAERKFRKKHLIDIDTFNKFCNRDYIIKRDE